MKIRLESGRSQTREHTQPLLDLEDEIQNAASTVPTVSGSAPFFGVSSSSGSVPVDSSIAVSVEDVVQTDVTVQPNVGIPFSGTSPVSSGTVGSRCLMNARPEISRI